MFAAHIPDSKAPDRDRQTTDNYNDYSDLIDMLNDVPTHSNHIVHGRSLFLVVYD